MSVRYRHPPRRSPPLPLIAVATCALAATGATHAQTTQFDAGFMQPFGGSSAGPNLDLDAIANSASVGPGIYPVVLRLNQSFFDRRNIRFVAESASGEVKPCLQSPLLEEMGVKLAALQTVRAPAECIDLEHLVDGSAVSFDSSRLALDISVPQIALRRDAAGYVASEEWDSGINAALLNYQFSAAQGRSDVQGSTQQYNLYLNAGVNVAGWRLRSNSSLTQSIEGGREWQRSNTYAQRDLPGATGTLTLGDSFTPGEVFDSLPLRGVQLASDLGMLPDSMQGYAPVIRGIAETQAKVEVRQNGYSLYSTYVPPGPFEIDDLNAANGSGELEVIITEADGRERRFTQPYATLGNLLRQGTWRYSLAAGEYNAAMEAGRPHFAQATLAYGLPFDYTLYSGLLGSDFYRAGQVGLGKSLGSFGAIALDFTQAATDTRHGQRDTGQSYGFRYGKAFASGTTVRFAGYRYSTEGYRSFTEAVWQQDDTTRHGITRRSKLEASMAQSMDYGSFYLNLSQQNYWGSSRRDRQAQFGFSTQHRGVTYGLYASKSLSDSSGESSQIAFTLSLPLGGGKSGTYGLTRNDDGSLDHRAGLNGQAGMDGRIAYNVDVNRSERGGNAGSASLNYRAPYANLGAGLSLGDGYQRGTVSASGSLLGHADGLEFGHTLGETMALVHVENTPNVGVLNAPGSLTNTRGYALVPYLTPYRKNRVSLDTRELPRSIDIDNGVTNLVPRRGAVVKASFKASHTEKLVLNLRLADGSLPPFGAQLLDAEGAEAGMVGAGGQALLATSGQAQTYTLKWGKRASEQCLLHIELEPLATEQIYRTLDLTCQAPARATRNTEPAQERAVEDMQ